MRQRVRRAQVVAVNPYIDRRSDYRMSGYDSDSSTDSPSPTKLKFPQGVVTPPSSPQETPPITSTTSDTDQNPKLPMLTSPAAQPAEVSQPTPPQQKQDVNSKGMTQTDIMIALVSVGVSATVFALILVYLKRRRSTRERSSQRTSNLPQAHHEPPDEKSARLYAESIRKLSSGQRPDSETIPANLYAQASEGQITSATPTAWPTLFPNPTVALHPPQAVQPYPRMTPAAVYPRSQVASIVYYPVNPNLPGMPPPAVTKLRASVALTDTTGRTSGTWNTWGIEQHR